MTKLQALRLLVVLLARGIFLPPNDPDEKQAIEPVIAIAELSGVPIITIEMLTDLIRAEVARLTVLEKISGFRPQSSDESDDNDGGGTPPGGGGPP